MHRSKPINSKIFVYSVAWNEEALLPYYLRHYAFADKIFIFDNESTDKTVEIAKTASNAVVRPLEWVSFHKNSLNEKVFHKNPIWQEVLTCFKNERWKDNRSEADWVIVCDIDEFLYHDHLFQYLAACKKEGVTIPHVSGYNMASEKFPTTSGHIYEEVNKGHADPVWFNKHIIFDPQIEEIRYKPGSHLCSPRGNVKYSPTYECKLLHYKFLGWDYLKSRWYSLRDRRSHENPQYSQHWKWPEEKLRTKYNEIMEQAVKVV